MIDDKYMEIIEQCENRLDELSDWERGFISGDPDDSKKPPLRERTFLSMGQKQILDRIVVERFEGGKWNNRKVQIEYGKVNADKTTEGWVVTIAGHSVGQGVTRKEAVIITAWVHSALAGIFGIPKDEISEYFGEQEVPEQVEEDEPF